MTPSSFATFFLSTGRCGTQWFCDVLAAAYGDSAVVTHEPLLGAYSPKRYLRNESGLAAAAPVAEHLATVGDILQRGWSYIETGWPCYVAVPLIVERFGPGARFIHLIRNPVSVALSLATHAVYRRDDWIRSGAVEPTDAGVLQQDLAGQWPTMNDYEKTLFWWTEVHLYIQELKERFPDSRFLTIRYEDFFDPAGGDYVDQLVEFMGLAPAPDLGRQRFRNVDQYRNVIPPVDWRLIFKYPRTCALAEELGYDADALHRLAAQGAYEQYCGIEF